MYVHTRSVRSLTVTLVLCGIVLLAARWAGALPPPPPKFWSVSRCERQLDRHDYVLPTARGYGFHVRQTVCVGTGGPHTCQWTADRRSRLYSEFTVFGRARFIGSIVRSWTLATRGGPGLVRVGGRTRTDFYASPTSVRLLALNSTPAGFRSIVAPIAARLTEQANAAGCTGA